MLGSLQAELVLSLNSSSTREATSDAKIPPVKKARSSLFGHYQVVSASTCQESRDRAPAQLLTQYLDFINHTETNLSIIRPGGAYSALHPLFERLLCVPASSAPVERVFSQSGLIMKPNRARLSDSLLEDLVFLKCNSL